MRKDSIMFSTSFPDGDGNATESGDQRAAERTAQ